MAIRQTYCLTAPSVARETHSIWRTNHSVEIDGDIDNDGVVAHFYDRETINIEIHEGEYLALDYAEAQRVALAILSAVEEAETMKENQ